jgi:serine/threonine protein kinase
VYGYTLCLSGAHGTAVEVCYPSKTLRNLLKNGIKSNVNTLKLSHSEDDPIRDKRGNSIPQAITLSERRKISPFHWEVDYSEIQIHDKIAEGSFGVVYRGLWRGIEVAVKKLSPMLLSNTEIFERFLHEVSLMSQLRHPNVLLFLGACLQPPDIALLTEYMPKGTLYNVLRKEKLEWHRKLAIAVETAKGLQYLHNHHPPVLHRDLKSLNLLVDDNYHIKVADFGLSQTKALTQTEQNRDDSKSLEIKGTICWQAPEVLSNGPYTEKSDIFSLGMVLYELLTERVPYEDKSFLQVLNAVNTQNEYPPIPSDCDPDFTQLLKDCWRKDPNSRPDINEVLKRLKTLRAKYLNLQLSTLTEVPTALELPSP